MRERIRMGCAALLLSLTLAGCVAVVRTRPPSPRVGHRTEAPFAGAVWIEGYWQFQRNDWVWMEGRWARQPWPDAYWEPGLWIESRGGWKWRDGKWRRERDRRDHRRDNRDDNRRDSRDDNRRDSPGY